MILKINRRVKESLIDEKLKNKISKELAILSKNYVNDMINITNNRYVY